MFNDFAKQADGPKRARKHKQNKINWHLPGPIREMESPGPVQEKARSRDLGKLLEERLAQSAMTEGESAYIQEALGRLMVIVRQAGEEWCARPFGSMASTFRTRDSDVDVTCLCQGALPADQSISSLISAKITPLFQSHPHFKVVEEVLHAKVPILKLRFDDRLDIDLSCQNTKALQNTRLLRAYADLDERVRSVVIAVKLWAKGAGVCGASRGMLSSYAFTLLAIYYLQVDPEVSLPSLPADAFLEEAYLGQDDEKIVSYFRGRWACPFDAVELLRRFFQFYCGAFQWGDEVVSIRLGERHTTGPQFPTLRGRHVQRLHIEDPFLLERNLHCVLGADEENLLWQAFAEAVHRFSVDLLPVGLAAAAISCEPSDCRSAQEDDGVCTLMRMLQQGKDSIEEDHPEPSAESTIAGHSSCSSDGGSVDEAPVGTPSAETAPSRGDGRCSGSCESSTSTRASIAQREAQEVCSDAESGCAAAAAAAAAAPRDRAGPADQRAAVPPEPAGAAWSEPSCRASWWQEAAAAGAEEVEGTTSTGGIPGELGVEDLLRRPCAALSTRTVAARVSRACVRQAA